MIEIAESNETMMPEINAAVCNQGLMSLGTAVIQPMIGAETPTMHLSGKAK